jgi:hypothetical protein
MVKFNNFQASLVKLSGSISIECLIAEIVAFVNTHIKKVSPDKIDLCLLRFICNIVENSYNKKDVVDKKIDKKQVVLDVYIALKPQCNNVEDKKTISNIIEDLHTSGQICKVSRVIYYYKLIKSHFFPKKQ